MFLEQFKDRKVLVLAAHPDDEIACSGTIAKMVDLDAIVGLIAFSRCEDIGNLEPEWQRAYDVLGINTYSLGILPNKQLPDHRQEILDALDEAKNDWKPDLIFTPARSDIHQDHAAVTAEAMRVFKWQTILGYEHPQNTVGSSIFQAYSDITQHMSLKIQHAECYGSQLDKPYMNREYIRGFAATRGMQAGVQYAEAFEVIRLQI